MAVNSFLFVPATFIFLIFAFGQMIFFQQGKLFVTALILFLIALLAQLILGALTD